LDHVLDPWFVTVVRQHCRGSCALIRYADGTLAVSEREDDARRFWRVLQISRLGQLGQYPRQRPFQRAALAEGLGIRTVARVFEVDPNTVLGWLVEAADHLEAFSHHFLRDLVVGQVQMDELFALLSAVKDGEVSKRQAIKRLSRSPHWVWVAMDPVCKLILSVDVGDRTLAMAQRLVHQVTQVLAPECAPLFLTDGFREYLSALVTHYGEWMQPKRRQAKGPQPKPRRMPGPGLLYAQVVKSYRRRRITAGTHRVVFGARETIESILAKRGWKISTSLIERLNLDFRQHVAAIGRRVNTLCKAEANRSRDRAGFCTTRALRLWIEGCNTSVQTCSSGSERDDEPSSRSTGLQPSVRLTGLLRWIGRGHAESDGSGLHELPEAVEFLELAVVCAHRGRRERNATLWRALETTHRRERSTVAHRRNHQFIEDGAIGETVDAVREMFPDLRGDIVASANDDIGAE
jgi:IS1 family transposase